MATWTNIPKPTASVWTNINPPGKEQYDQADITYDSATTFYDGANPTMWTNIPKPSVSAWVNIAKST